LAKQNHDESYANFVCKFPFSFYVERIRRLGFVGKSQVLDVGCGFGQWAAALALLNGRVVAIEQNHSRLGIARELIKASGLSNVEFVLGDALALLDREGSVFDAIFCYGVFMFLDRQKALSMFWQVLRPGGELYVCTNGFGWWLKLWLEHLIGNRHVRQAAYKAMRQGHRDGIPNSTNRADVGALLMPSEWECLGIGHEGELSRSAGDTVPLPVYRGSFLGLDCVIEFLAKKKAPGSLSIPETDAQERRNEAITTLQQAVFRTLSMKKYEYLTPLRQHPQPRPALDLVNNCFPHMIERALLLSRSTDRVRQLQWVFEQVTASCRFEHEVIQACLTFAQCHFFHHFAGQPMQAGNVPLLDPVAAFMLGFGRCGTIARFLVDLFECKGIPARLITTGCHTTAEVWCQGRWVLAEASLYPPGLYPTDDAGNHLGLEEAILNPSWLDRCPSYINYHHDYVDVFLSEYPETASAVERYLRNPLLPSSAYFGHEYYAGRVAGQVERLKKVGGPRDWNADERFGWLLGYEREIIQGPVFPARQRPGQVAHLSFKDGHLIWEPPLGWENGKNVAYHLIVSARARGWGYNDLPVGCTFSVTGHSIRTNERRINAKAVAGLGRYLTIIVEVPEWRSEPIFYLPSKEFDLQEVL
jgi:SAM-dependent methyltransferase